VRGNIYLSVSVCLCACLCACVKYALACSAAYLRGIFDRFLCGLRREGHHWTRVCAAPACDVPDSVTLRLSMFSNTQGAMCSKRCMIASEYLKGINIESIELALEIREGCIHIDGADGGDEFILRKRPHLIHATHDSTSLA
jgi:hypothetical protein